MAVPSRTSLRRAVRLFRCTMPASVIRVAVSVSSRKALRFEARNIGIVDRVARQIEGNEPL